MRFVFTIFVVYLGLGAAAQARDIFVNNISGDDRNQGFTAVPSGAQGGPCRTITKALRLAEKGDRIVLAKNDEPYRESITLQAGRHSGIPSSPFVIEGNGAVLDGRQPVPPNVWENVQGDTFRFRPTHASFHLLYLDDRPAVRRDIDVAVPRLPQLQPLEWCLFDHQLYFRVAPDHLPRSYKLTHTVLPVGITLYEVRHLRINDLVVQGFQLDGVNAHDSVFDASLVGLTCRGNGRSGISVGGASRLRVEACLVGNNGVAQIRTEGQSVTRIVNCNLLNNTGPAVKREGGEVFMDQAEAKTAELPLRKF